MNDKESFLEIIAFRGSSKSCLASLIFPIWSVINTKTKFILLLSDTFSQSKLVLNNIKQELENNKLLVQDFGFFESKNAEWTATDIFFKKYNARISSRSSGQKIRGIRHGQYRVQLAIIDDVENLEATRTKDGRDKTFEWLVSDVFPAMADESKIVLIGNLLHSDCIMSRIKKQILEEQREGTLLEFPLIDNGKILWKEKFPDMASIEKEKRRINDSIIWQREFLLKLIAPGGAVVKQDWIEHYDSLPPIEPLHQGIGIDLAISKKETADFTAMVSAKLYKIDGQLKIYIIRNPVNDRLSFREMIEKTKSVKATLGECQLFVEDVAYQKAAIEQMLAEGLPAKGIKVSVDKRSRLETVASYIQSGQVLFPKTGCEDLIQQLLFFGVEKWDDLADSFSLVVSGLMNNAQVGEPRMTIFTVGDDEDTEEEPEPLKPLFYSQPRRADD